MEIRIAYVDDSPIQQELVLDHLQSKTFQNENFPEQDFRFKVVAFGSYEEFLSCPESDILLLDIDLGRDDD